MTILLKQIDNTKDILRSRCLYHVEERVLTAVFSHQRAPCGYSVTIPFGDLYIDVTEAGEPLSIDVHLPRKEWRSDDILVVPQRYETGRVFFNSETDKDRTGVSLTNKEKNILHIRYSEHRISTYKVADTVLIDLDANGELAGIWFIGISNDFLYLKEMSWRLRKKFLRKLRGHVPIDARGIGNSGDTEIPGTRT